MKAIMMTVRLWWFYLTYKGIKKAEIRKRFAKDFKGKIYECVSKTNWKKDLMKIPEEEREFFKQFVGKVGLCFECDKVDKWDGAAYVIHNSLNYPFKDLKEDILNNAEEYDKEEAIDELNWYEEFLFKSCLTRKELSDYVGYKWFYAIHITNLEIFDKPKEISEFKQQYDYFAKNKTCNNCPCVNCNSCIATKPLTRAPQSWCYIEV